MLGHLLNQCNTGSRWGPETAWGMPISWLWLTAGSVTRPVQLRKFRNRTEFMVPMQFPRGLLCQQRRRRRLLLELEGQGISRPEKPCHRKVK